VVPYHKDIQPNICVKNSFLPLKKKRRKLNVSFQNNLRSIKKKERIDLFLTEQQKLASKALKFSVLLLYF